MIPFLLLTSRHAREARFGFIYDDPAFAIAFRTYYFYVISRAPAPECAFFTTLARRFRHYLQRSLFCSWYQDEPGKRISMLFTAIPFLWLILINDGGTKLIELITLSFR